MTNFSRRNGLVVSDLHLFSRRSDGDRLFDGVASRLDSVDALVLNGDTFDFRWSRLATESATVEAAIDWLEALLEQWPDGEIHFILGNHDCLAAFREPLEALASVNTRLHCHEYRIQLGRCLFLHGDCANRPMDAAGLERFRASWSRDRKRGRVAASAYRSADALGLSRRFHDLYFPEMRTVKRIAHHLDHVTPGWPNTIRHCYFGHTHRPFREFRWRGVRFANTGSGIRGMGFQPLEFSWNPSPPTRPEFSPRMKSSGDHPSES